MEKVGKKMFQRISPVNDVITIIANIHVIIRRKFVNANVNRDIFHEEKNFDWFDQVEHNEQH